jgi:hypothetical protein
LRRGFRVWPNQTEERDTVLGKDFFQRRKKLTRGQGGQREEEGSARWGPLVGGREREKIPFRV